MADEKQVETSVEAAGADAASAPAEPKKAVSAKRATAAKKASAKPESVRRAGGHVDRGDGKGWVVDTDPPAKPKKEPVGPGGPPTPLGTGRYGGYQLAGTQAEE